MILFPFLSFFFFPNERTGLNVIVTGANTGIGRETARELARAGVSDVQRCLPPNFTSCG